MRLDATTVEALASFVPIPDLAAMRVIAGKPGCWLPALLGMSAVTVAPWVLFRAGTYQPGTARGMALIGHEAHHIRQGREMGRGWFYVKYLKGQFTCRFRHGAHPMEMPAIEIQRAVFRALSGQG